MIPYDDLVAALSAWRARQGLPVVQAAGAAPARPATPAPVPAPAPPPAPAKRAVSAPMAAAAVSDFDDGSSAMIEEQHYDDAGDDYVVPFGNAESTGESTSIGAPPAHGKRNDW